MSLLNNFFRGTPSDFQFKAFSGLHWFFIAIALLGVFYIIERRDSLREKNSFRNLLVYTLLVQQLVLYLWYLKSGYFSLSESLPLYNCRIAIIAIVIGELFSRDKLKYIGMYWGLMGSILALLVPVLDPFGYDHYTFYSFFIGHIFLLWASLYLLLVEEKSISESSLKNILRFTTVYHIAMIAVNLRTQGNYCYLIESPIFADRLDNMSQFIYSLIVIILFNVIMVLTHKTLGKISNKFLS